MVFRLPSLFLCLSLLMASVSGSRVFAQQPLGGAVDTSFSGDGQASVMLPGFTSPGSVLAVQADGKIVAAGQAWDGLTCYRLMLTRFLGDGSLDTSFGVGGVVTYGPERAQAYAVRDMKLLADGKILVALTTAENSIIVRYLETGELDPSFTVVKIPVGTGSFGPMAVQSDGKILLRDSEKVMRLLANGSVDTSFASSGTLAVPSGFTVRCVLPLPDGRILYGGRKEDGQNGYVGCVSSAGAAITAFGTSGRAMIPFTTFGGGIVIDMALDGAGNIAVAASSGYDSTDVNVARLSSAGVLDTSFSADGIVRINSFGTLNGVVVQADGRPIMWGYQGANLVMRRFLWNGDNDLSFDGDGLRTVSGTGAKAGMALQTDGKLLATTLAIGTNPFKALAVSRYHPGATLPMPVITISQDPVGQTVNLGATVTFVVEAESTAPATFVWYRGIDELARGGSKTFVMTNAQTSHEGDYRVEILSLNTRKSSAPATLKVVSPPVVTSTNSPSADGLLGGQWTANVSLSGRTPVTCKWYHGEDLVKTQTGALTGTFLTLNPLTANDTGNYWVEVSNADGTIKSRDFPLTVMPDPWARNLQSSVMVGTGEALMLYARVGSSTDYRVQWHRNGIAILDAREQQFDVSSAKLSDAGTYIMRLRSLVGVAEGSPIEVAVVDINPARWVVAAGQMFRLEAKAAGPGLSFEWWKDGQQVVASERVNGINTAVLSFSSLEAGDAGAYQCLVRALGGERMTGVQTLVVPVAVPTLAALTFPAAQIGLRYEHTVPLLPETSHLEITGLPAGFRYSMADRRLTGTPTKPGTFPLKIVAVNPWGKSAPLTVPFVVLPLPAGFTGRFHGSIGSYESLGAMDLNVTPNGTDTGKVELLSTTRNRLVTWPFTGAFTVDNGPAG
ncbi:MAG: hypothetical protein U0984_06980, partial [Prosthecobacter sp.]|nr:hypothetical protein [Prosthecobacter sp.]